MKINPVTGWVTRIRPIVENDVDVEKQRKRKYFKEYRKRNKQ